MTHANVKASVKTNPSAKKSESAGSASDEARAIASALDKSQAVIYFDPSGKILEANDLFLQVMNYSLDEIQGKHHSMFIDPAYASSIQYRQFWEALGRGEYQTDIFKRIGKGGKEVWIQASYNPLTDKNGKVYKVVKFATDITEQRLRNADYEGQIAAIGKAQAIIEFNLDGTIVTANPNFLNTLGYRLEEIQGKHHRMFVEHAYEASPDYAQFWSDLRNGEFQAGEYKRIGKGGREVWIQASYNPILDLNGKPFKIVKYATDITADKVRNADYEGQIAAVSKSQAVIQFNMEGTIMDANENFLSVMGYRLEEIKGKHHSMFVEPAYQSSPDYARFWDSLRRGEYQAAEYKRIGKGGKEVWIQASYNPILDLNGKPFKVVKYATDLTEQKAQKKRDMEMLANNFQGRVQSIISSVASASTELAHTAELMSKSIGESNVNAQDAVKSSEETFQNVQTVAAASEEMSATIKEISSQTQNANSLISDSVEKVKGADAHATELQNASQQVRNVIQLISNISSQINLLALNATIESARAGEAGKGFAVVANEVRNLAGQTNKSIQDIEKVITDMSRASDGVISALGGIKDSVDKIFSSSAGIASAVEEQSAVVNDIAQNMNIATHKTQAVKENITSVSQLSGEAEQNSQQVLIASQDLSRQAEDLEREVAEFLSEVRAG